MKLNLKYYDKKDKYSDGDIEDRIIELIKKYPDNYEDAFKEDDSWATVYHLSDTRKNVIRWYPFKKNSSILEVGAGMGAITEELRNLCANVTSIELSKRRATAILERNKNVNNLEIIVGNFKNIKLTEKYDYILLNGVLEYAALYMDTNNPYQDLLLKLKENLKTNGKILIAIENKTGLKYWCGANEDHTGKMFDGLNNYPENKSIKTFSKYELENIAANINMHANFYYMFPDYKFPKIVLTDNFLKRDIFVDYTPYYCGEMNTILNEHSLYKEAFENHTIPFFANSYFIELSSKEEPIEIEFAKFNSEYRKQEYNLCTYLRNNKYYKKTLNNKAKNHIETILKINDICINNNIDIVKVHKENAEIYTDSVTGEYLVDKIKRLYKEEKYKEIEKIFDSVYTIIKNTAGKKVESENNIFTRYGIKDYPKDLEFYEHGIIDIIPDNIIVKDKKYYLIDQEWYEENVPLEYILFRAITNTMNQIDINCELKKQLYKKYKITEKVFIDLQEKFMNSIRNQFYSSYIKFINNYIYIKDLNEVIANSNKVPNLLENINNINEKIKQNEELITTLKKEKEECEQKYNLIVTSKRWKIINKIANLIHR